MIDDVSSFDPTANNATANSDAIRQAAEARQKSQDKSGANIINTGTGIIGAIISGVATGNPAIGYNLGKNIGVGDAIKGTGDIKMPGVDQLKALFGKKQAASSAADVATGAAASSEAIPAAATAIEEAW